MTDKHYVQYEIEDYVSVPERCSFAKLLHSSNSGKLPKLKPYYEVSKLYLTRTAKYLFYVELEMYYDEYLKRAIRKLQKPSADKDYKIPNVYLDDENNSYDVNKTISNEEDKFIYHVLIDARHENFEECIDLMRRSPFYINDYVSSVEPAKTVVQIKTICKKRIITFLQNKFSKLYEEKEYEALTHNPYIFLSYFEIDYSKGCFYFNDVSAVLVGIAIDFAEESEAEALIQKLNIDDEETKSIIRERHKSYTIETIQKHGQKIIV